MAIMLNSRSNVYENIFSSASQPPDSSTLLQPAGIAGPARAKQILCLANDRIAAADALAWGLVQEVVPDGDAAARARVLADRAAAMPPVPLRMTKATVNAIAAANAAAAVHMDTEEVMLTESTEDFEEAMAAFRERRVPEFRGA